MHFYDRRLRAEIIAHQDTRRKVEGLVIEAKRKDEEVYAGAIIPDSWSFVFPNNLNLVSFTRIISYYVLFMYIAKAVQRAYS